MSNLYLRGEIFILKIDKKGIIIHGNLSSLIKIEIN
jgi:hypothetical protein